MENKTYKTKEILDVLFKTWSLESSSKWNKENPALGQCGVTALVVNDILGGEINKTKLPGGWHFYNIINGKRYDFTDSQFIEEIIYRDIPSNREEASKDTNEKQYNYLKHNVLFNLS
ncbi:hypothetical protein M2M59_09365 [Rummeliibacillus sp. G93]|uniref:YunG family protein n=1 Tax=Rummeliibacillus sp. G93 TaxID=2939494 RepID=UPI00201C02BB|nr:hypothetical protein [Rummeliibacillus sp. G93]UQW96222.1 hypothetical protein M2M59_09365 [Rummeliibacillus sp. G93]